MISTRGAAIQLHSAASRTKTRGRGSAPRKCQRDPGRTKRQLTHEVLQHVLNHFLGEMSGVWRRGGVWRGTWLSG